MTNKKASLAGGFFVYLTVDHLPDDDLDSPIVRFALAVLAGVVANAVWRLLTD